MKEKACIQNCPQVTDNVNYAHSCRVKYAHSKTHRCWLELHRIQIRTFAHIVVGFYLFSLINHFLSYWKFKTKGVSIYSLALIGLLSLTPIGTFLIFLQEISDGLLKWMIMSVWKSYIFLLAFSKDQWNQITLLCHSPYYITWSMSYHMGFHRSLVRVNS